LLFHSSLNNDSLLGKIKSHATLSAEADAVASAQNTARPKSSNENNGESNGNAAVGADAGAEGELNMDAMNANYAMMRRRSTVKLNRFQLQEEQRKAKREQMSKASKLHEKQLKAEIKDVFNSNPLTDIASYCKPLMKQRVYELTHRQDSYANKWSRMKEIRDGRFQQMQRKEDRGDMMHALQKTINNSEKMEYDAALSAAQLAHRQERDYLHNKNKYSEDMSSWRRNVYHRQESLRKEVGARDLRRAIGSALNIVQEEKSRDIYDKSIHKPDSAITRFSEHTSYTVPVPSEVLDRVKHAKRYSEYKDAKRNAETYVERTISNRIQRYASARNLAMARAASTGAPVSVNTLFGDLMFSAESDSALAGVAATMSLAYSSTLSMLDNSQHEPGRPGSPGFYAHNDSNIFLKELAEKEYLARKQSYYDEGEEIPNRAVHPNLRDEEIRTGREFRLPSGEHPSTQQFMSGGDDDAASEASWKTDPRLADIGVL
jgi:hypothetical protein